MPELPEVETVCQGLNQVTLAQEILGGQVLRNSTIAHPVSVLDFISALQGHSIAQWHRRGKYLLAELVDRRTRPSQFPIQHPSGWLGVHLRMTGQLLWCRPKDPLQKHTRVRLFFAHDRELRFVDTRTFGKMWWVPPETDPSHIITGLQKLGPEPFSQEFSPDYLALMLHQRRRPIKNALLDQAIVAGVGNIYADETLFLSGIPPTKPCIQLTPAEIDRIHTHLIQVLREAIEVGGTTFSTFLNVQGINGNYAVLAWVYKRAGQPCRRCGTPIQRLKLGGRSSHFCPHCQSGSGIDKNGRETGENSS